LNYYKTKKPVTTPKAVAPTKPPNFTIQPAAEAGLKTRLTPDYDAIRKWYYPSAGGDVRKY
jgi:hypothetical protein